MRSAFRSQSSYFVKLHYCLSGGPRRDLALLCLPGAERMQSLYMNMLFMFSATFRKVL